MSAAAVTTGLYTHGAVDEAAYQRWLAKETAQNFRLRAKGRALWIDKTDEDLREIARMYCETYRHHYRVLVQIDPATRLPVVAPVA